MLLRTRAKRRELMAWQWGETTASPGEVMAVNGLTATDIAGRVLGALKG